jgi:hypothetical protein
VWLVVSYRRFRTTSAPTVKGPIGYPENSITNCHSALSKLPEEWRSQITSCISVVCWSHDGLHCYTESRRARKSVTVVTEVHVWISCSINSVCSKFSHTVSMWLVLLFSHLWLGLLGRLLPLFYVSVPSISHSPHPTTSLFGVRTHDIACRLRRERFWIIFWRFPFLICARISILPVDILCGIPEYFKANYRIKFYYFVRVTVHLRKVLEMMSTSVYTGLNPFNLYPANVEYWVSS